MFYIGQYCCSYYGSVVAFLEGGCILECDEVIQGIENNTMTQTRKLPQETTNTQLRIAANKSLPFLCDSMM